MAQTTTEQSLYHRLGGYDAIAASVDDLLERLTNDPQLAVYWKGKSESSMRKDRQLIVDFMAEAAGGPVFYGGRDMRTSHTGMGITEAEWQIFMRHSAATLDHFEVPERERQEVLRFLESLKPEVVSR